MNGLLDFDLSFKLGVYKTVYIASRFLIVLQSQPKYLKQSKTIQQN